MTINGTNIVVVGAGHAGGRAVEALRGAGFDGDITLVGEEMSPPYERPPLSKEFLAGSIDASKLLVRPLEYYQEQRIALRLGTRAERIDRSAARLELSDGSSIPYDRLLLTTGARARRLQLPEAFGDRIHYIRDVADSDGLRPKLVAGARVVVIGAGLIGLEVAATAQQLGCTVTVVEFAPHPMNRAVPGVIGAFFAELHQSRGVEVLTDTSVATISSHAKGVIIRTSAGLDLAADLIVVGIGSVPNTELAEVANLQVSDGIVTDEFGRTSDPAIFAAGDVTRHFNPLLGRQIRLEAWQNAQNQAVAVAKVLAGGQEPYAEVPWFWSDQFDVNLQVAGAPSDWDQIVWRGELSARKCTAILLSGRRVVGGICLNNGRDMRFVRKMIADGRPRDPAALSDAAVNMAQL